MAFENLTAAQMELVTQGAVSLEAQRRTAAATTPRPQDDSATRVAVAGLMGGQGQAQTRAVNSVRAMDEGGQSPVGDRRYAALRGRRSAPAPEQRMFPMRRC